ncbi:hypothetical protein CNYM01_08728 [Colletotrichum nymphaeae SA-01]|uniref:Methyltransferase domain-containing protein n=1 Tax=Colletotrichum nymphaeae SA-01 TaxID=1460502 RepID=A0A135SS17_9PEZI|nr:hypothetical protein CNYM01_08728 [Colletotrichum nymphaeae SA-01]
MSDDKQPRSASHSPKLASSRGASLNNANNATTKTTPALDADELGEDDLSVKGESIVSSNASVTSSVLQFRKENGRTYHGYKDGMNSKDTNIKAKRVLDIGTGSGIWAMDFADEHPESEVLGVDLSPIQPTFVPPNVRFEIDDIEEAWAFCKPFDYIHSRLMTSSIGDWQEYIQKCFDNLNPNGYLELNEVDLYCKSDDGTLADDSALNRFSKLWGEAAVIFGHAFQDNTALKDLMAKAGFVDITVQVFKWPSNPWPLDAKHKELGFWNLDNSVAGLEGFMLGALTRAHKWTKDEVTVFATEVRNEMKDPRIHSYQTIWSVYGRKPAAEEVAVN